MTKKAPVSSQQNIFYDSEQLDETDLTLEQNYNNNFQTSLINNQIGNGVIPNTLGPNVLFDSSLFSGLFDGYAIFPQSQPSDTNYGNQLAVQLSHSLVAGKKNVKIAIIGLDFNGNLQYDTLTFKVNEIQITKKHYASILLLLFNDFIGTAVQSFNLGGRVVISESTQLDVSRDPIMVAQDVEPSLFWRDFFVSSGTLQTFLTAALPLYDIGNLGIKTGYLQNSVIAANDITTQIGEKFQATTNNIEKVTLLMGVQNTQGSPSNLVWTGELLISIYALQSAVECPTDIIPNLAIDYPPSNIPLAQLSLGYNDFLAMGVVLNGNVQPVDFVLSNTQTANGSSIVPGSYYAVVVKRAGQADTCDMLLATGGSYSTTSRLTTFTGTDWVDTADQELWFRVWTDAIKVTDGQAYESGHGVIVPKTELDASTNAQVDYSEDAIQFNGNQLYTAVLQATSLASTQVQDQRTGNPIESRQQFVPTITLYNPIDLTNLEAASEPFVIGSVEDENQKAKPTINNQTITAALHGWDFIDNQLVIPIITDQTDNRYDANVISLVTNLLNGDFQNAQIIPDGYNPSIYYRISKSELVSMLYGDVDNDGLITANDVTELTNLVGMEINQSPPPTTTVTGYPNNISPVFYSVVNGYQTLTNPFVSDLVIPIVFYIIDPTVTDITMNNFSGPFPDGYLTVNPNDGSKATFYSPTVTFGSNISSLKLFIKTSSNSNNIGLFNIFGQDPAGVHYIDIGKNFFSSSDLLLQLLRADIDGDGYITSTDGYLLQQYVYNAPVLPNTTFPPTQLPQSKIGTRFNALRLTVDPYVDRTDDFSSTTPNRSAALHPMQDIFSNDATLQNRNFRVSPVPFSIIKQFSWEDFLIAVSGGARPIPTVFTSLNDNLPNQTHPQGNVYETYPLSPSFNPGANNVFAPNDVIIGTGDLKRPDGSFYKVDFEVGSVTLEIPNTVLGVEQTINIFDYFVVDFNGSGITRLGYPAMRFADFSTVQTTAIQNNQIRFSVATQSFSPNLDGYDATIDGYGIIVDGRMGIFLDNTTGLLRLNFANLYQDPTLQTLATKVQINVFLKKGGFTNAPLSVSSMQMENLLTLIS